MIENIFKLIIFFVLAFFGFVLVASLMVFAAIVVGIMFIASKIKGKPFSAKDYWQQKTADVKATNARFKSSFGSANGKPFNKKDVTDVDVRDVD